MRAHKSIALGLISITWVLITCLDSWGEPRAISRCVTIHNPGSYNITRNLTATGDCIVIKTDYVTIDLAGFTISGSGSGSGIVAVPPEDGDRKAITVRNGMVRGFAHGVDLSNTVLAVAERLTVVGNSQTGLGIGGWGKVKDCLAQDNGIGILAGASVVVTNSVASFNQRTPGIGFELGYNNTVIGNIAQENGSHGIRVSNGSTIVNNSSSAHPQAGFQVVCPSNLIGNTASFNGTHYDLQSSGCNSSNNVP
jgi:hypothetical protein